MQEACGLPQFFTPLLAQWYSQHDVQRIVDGCACQRSTMLRANTLLSSREEVEAALGDAGIPWKPVAWYRDAFVLPANSERTLWDLPLYQQGHVYLQNLSAMIPALVLGARAGEDVCDLCAAPGGKTSQIAALCHNGAFITACELHAPRAEKLQHNVQKQGVRNINVMRTDARELSEFFSFDRLLLDAPCSGSGTLQANDPRVQKRFTEKLITKSQKAQRALLKKALQLVKPGGTVVYSTCSVLKCENEDIVTAALQHAPKGRTFEIKPVQLEGMDELPTLPSSIEGALTLCPTEDYEGFFVSIISRKN